MADITNDPKNDEAPRKLLGRALLAVATTSLLLSACGSPGPETATSGAAGRGASYTTWDGEKATTAGFEGKPLVVNFWASWCTSCLHEIPAFVKVYERHAPNVAFLGLNLQDDRDVAANLARELGITYELGRDPQGTAFQAFGAVAMPTTVLLDADGDIVRRFDGEVSADQLETELEQLLEGTL